MLLMVYFHSTFLFPLLLLNLWSIDHQHPAQLSFKCEREDFLEEKWRAFVTTRSDLQEMFKEFSRKTENNTGQKLRPTFKRALEKE